MKLFLLLVCAAVMTCRSQAQIVIDAGRMPVAGDRVVTLPMDTANVNPGSTGAGQSWDFSAAVVDGDSVILEYLVPSATPYAATFPAATLASTYQDGEYVSYVYYDVSGGRLDVLGSASDDFTIINHDPETILTFPFSYGATLEDAFTSTFSVSGGMISRRSGSMQANADAWGALTLPGGETRPALRVTQTETTRDTVFLNGQPMFVSVVRTVSHEWYTAGHKFPVFIVAYIDIDANGNHSSHKIVDFKPGQPATGVTDRQRETPSGVSLDQNFPNPFNPATTIRYALGKAAHITLEVFSLLGERVALLLDNEFRSAGSYEIVYHATTLPSGIYFYRLRAGRDVETRSFTLLK